MSSPFHTGTSGSVSASNSLPPLPLPSLHRHHPDLVWVGLRHGTAIMATATPRLDSIAPELLQMILGFISGPDTSDGGTVKVRVWRVPSLHALTMVSKQLRYEALPYLYRRFESRNGDLSLPLFVRSLCENPELAKCVQFFHTSVFESQSQIPNPGDIETLKAALVPLKLTKNYHHVRAALDNECASAFSLLLTSLTTRLRCLDLDFHRSAQLSGRSKAQLHNDLSCPCCCKFNESLQEILASHTLRHQYANLEKFQFEPRDQGGVGLLAAVLELPAMKTIELVSFGDISGLYDWTVCANLSTVENVYFENSFLHDQSVAGLIACCKKLKSLSFWWDSDAIDVYGGTPLPAIDTSTILAALRPQRECLERLVLTNSQGPSFVSSYQTHELSSLKALTELDVDDNFLLEGKNWDRFKLPPHLRVLIIYMETPFIGFTQVFRAIGQTAQRDLSDVTITIPFEGNESHTDPFVGVWEVFGTDEPEFRMMAIRIDMNKEGPPWFYRLWTEDVSHNIKMRFLGEGMGQLMNFFAEQVVIHGMDFLVNTEDYLTNLRPPHVAK